MSFIINQIISKPSIYLLNYVSKGWPSAKNNNNWARFFLKPKMIFSYTEQILNREFPEFCAKNRQLLDQPRGGGYWVWKPFLIFNVLTKLPQGAYLIYYDSGISLKYRIWSDCSSFIQWMELNEFSFMPGIRIPEFGANRNWCKFEAYRNQIPVEQLDNFLSESQFQATFSIWRNDAKSMLFLKQWIDLCENNILIDDFIADQSCEHPDFIEHRHDQALLSLLCFQKNIASINEKDEVIPFNKCISFVDLYLRTKNGGFFEKLRYRLVFTFVKIYFFMHKNKSFT